MDHKALKNEDTGMDDLVMDIFSRLRYDRDLDGLYLSVAQKHAMENIRSEIRYDHERSQVELLAYIKDVLWSEPVEGTTMTNSELAGSLVEVAEQLIGEAFTKQHYIAIAGILKGGGTVVEIAKQLAALFAADNPRFDRTRFLTACGIEE